MAPKLDAIRTIVPGNVDIMVFSETKLDDSYPTTQLLIEGFGKPFRLVKNARGWWSSYLCQVGQPLHYQKWSLGRVRMVKSQYAVLMKILILMAHFFLKNICLKNF